LDQGEKVSSGSLNDNLGTSAEGISAQQFAFGDQDLIGGDIAPVPETPPWWAATMAAGFVG
jgi:hypothetical protein